MAFLLEALIWHGNSATWSVELQTWGRWSWQKSHTLFAPGGRSLGKPPTQRDTIIDHSRMDPKEPTFPAAVAGCKDAEGLPKTTKNRFYWLDWRKTAKPTGLHLQSTKLGLSRKNQGSFEFLSSPARLKILAIFSFGSLLLMQIRSKKIRSLGILRRSRLLATEQIALWTVTRSVLEKEEINNMFKKIL